MDSGRAKASVRNETEPFVLSAAIVVLIVANRLLNSRLAPGGWVANVALLAVMAVVEVKDVGVAFKRLEPTGLALLTNFVFPPGIAWLVLRRSHDVWPGVGALGAAEHEEPPAAAPAGQEQGPSALLDGGRDARRSDTLNRNDTRPGIGSEMVQMGIADLQTNNTKDEAAALAAGSAVAPLARLRGFHPGWFGAVMGTAIVGMAASANPGGLAALAGPARTLGQVMAVLAALLAVVLGAGYVGRFVWHRDATLADLRDPVAGALYGTLPGGILVLAAAAAAIGPTWFSPSTVRDLVAGLDWVGVPLAFVMSVVFAYLLFVRSELVPETVNGGWFIPPVVNIVVPLVLVPLIPGASPATARALLFASYGFFGIGLLLYLLVLAMLHHRLVLQPLPHAGLAPSLWIGLGPIGVGALALVKMAGAGTGAFGVAEPTVAMVSKLAATALWGFGVWWLAAAVLLLVHYLRSGPLPYGLGWWGFTFPLGAYTVATLALAKAWDLRGLVWAGAGLFVLLGLFWLLVAGRTTWALRTGEAWKAATPPGGPAAVPQPAVVPSAARRGPAAASPTSGRSPLASIAKDDHHGESG